MHCVISHIIY